MDKTSARADILDLLAEGRAQRIQRIYEEVLTDSEIGDTESNRYSDVDSTEEELIRQFGARYIRRLENFANEDAERQMNWMPVPRNNRRARLARTVAIIINR